MGRDFGPKITNRIADSRISMYLGQFRAIEYSVNFKAIIFISDTKSSDKETVMTIIIHQLFNSAYWPNQKGAPETKKAAAGVGMPMKEVDCLVSILNFASRYAEKTVIKNET